MLIMSSIVTKQSFEIFSQLKAQDPVFSTSKNISLVYHMGLCGLTLVAFKEIIPAGRTEQEERDHILAIQKVVQKPIREVKYFYGAVQRDQIFSTKLFN
jgi:hypothetical protein